MVRIRGASLVGVLSIVVAASACSAAAVGSAGGGSRVALRPAPGADAVPTTSAAVPITPTTALPNLPTVPTVAPPPTAVATTLAPVAFVPVQDDYGLLTIEIPATWTDVDTRPFINDDDTLRPGISASTDLAAFDDQWDVPGLVYTAYRFEADANVLLADYDYSNQCTDAGTVAYDDGVFVGYLRTFTECSAARSTNYVIVANAPANRLTVVLVVQVVTPSDAGVFQHIVDTFNVDPNVSMPVETVPADPSTTAVPQPTTPVPTAAPPTVAPPTVPAGTVAPSVPMPTVPAPPVLPTSPLLTTAPSSVPAVTPTVPAVPAGYQEVTDDTGRLVVQVPSTWIEIDGGSAVEAGIEVAALSAAPSLTTFRETFGGPGLLLHEARFVTDPAAELARRGLAGTCTAGPVIPNVNPAFTGVSQSWLDCGGTTADIHVLVANPVDGRSTTVVLVVQTLTAADEAARDVAFSSYRLATTV